MIKVKICGITNLDDARAATRAGCDALGFIFAPSPRRVRPAPVKKIASAFPKTLCKVGVFVNEEAERMEAIARECSLSALQLHGDEPPGYAERLRENFKIIKAFQIKDAEDIEKLRGYPADFYLLDTFAEGLAGGSGKTFPWELAVKAKEFGVPIILSGGLNAENIREAIRKVAPFGVDTSSGVEKSPGKKDPRLITEFIKAVRSEESGNS